MSGLVVWLSGFRGEVAALAAAWIWAMATVVYRRVGQRLPPLVLNLLKGAIAIAFLGLTLVLRIGVASPLKNPNMAAPDRLAVGLLFLSGVLGIGIGDTAYFAALNRLGARKTLLLETLAPPLAALMALFFLQEQLSWQAWCGILVTLTGVTWVIAERVTESASEKSKTLTGIGFGLLAAITQAGGAVLSRTALTQTSISPLWSGLIRVMAGSLWLLPWVLMRRQASFLLAPLRSKRLFGAILIAAFASTYLAIWLQQTALKFSATGIAQTLLATSPLFVLPLAVLMKERVSLRAVLGATIACAGIGILISGR